MSNAQPNFTWGPPPPSKLQFSNCTSASQVFISLFFNNEYPYETGGAFLLNGLESYLKNNSLPNPPLYELAHWYQWTQSTANETSMSDMDMAIMNYVDDHCNDQLCPQLGYQGNPDVAGRGMIVTYFVQALLVAIYIPILLGLRYKKVPKAFRSSSAMSTFIVAVQHSTTSFLNASFVFTVSMLIAGIVSNILGFLGTSVNSLDAPFVSSLMSMYSTLPPLLIQMVASKVLRRQKGLRVIWIFISVLNLAMAGQTIAVYVLYDKYGQESKTQKLSAASSIQENKLDYWEYTCAYAPQSFFIYMVVVFWGMSTLVALVYILRTFIFLFWKPGATRGKRGKFMRILWWASILFVFTSMWFILIWFIYFNSKTGTNAGESDQETSWSFGQILSLATWVPVIVELCYIWWESPAEAINGRLMDPYEVVDVSKKGEDMEELVWTETNDTR